MALLNLFEESYQLGERGESNQRCINFYFEQYEGDGKKTKTASALATVLGASVAHNFGSESKICRGLYYSSTGPAPDYKSRLYGVWGDTLYRFGSDNVTPYIVGSVTDNGLPVTMTDNGQGRYFFLTDGVSAYSSLMADGDGIATLKVVQMPIIPGSDIGGGTGVVISPSHCAFIAQRLVVNASGTSYFFYGDLTDPTTMDGGTIFQDGNFYSDESSGDTISALKVVNGSLVTLGFRSYSVWRPTSNQDNPLSVTSGTSNAIGIDAPFSLAGVDDKLFWLASSDVGTLGVYMLQNTSIKRVSTMGIDETLMTLNNRSRAIACAYSYKGNFFYVLTFLSEGRTFVYDAGVDKWHERLSRNFSTGAWDVWLYNYLTVANGVIYAGVIKDGSALVTLSDDRYYEWDGRQILREGWSKPMFDGLEPMTIQELTLDMQVGSTEILSGIGAEPVVMLQISRDGGYSWSNISKRSLGKQGNYRKKISWFGLGTGRNWAFKVSVSDPVPCMIYQTSIKYKKGVV